MAEPEQGPMIETYISAVRGALKWAAPPAPEGISPSDWRDAFMHAFDVIAAAARDNLRKIEQTASVPAAPNRAARRKPPAKPAKPPAKRARK